MARPMRIDYPGATHHITARGHQKKRIFKDDKDREHFLKLLEQCARHYRWTITVYVLMTNHFHFVVQTTKPNLGIGMRCLNSAYAGWFNARYKRINSLFGDRYSSVLVESEVYMQRLARYVVLNPVRAKMVEHAGDYKWSSYPATAGDVPAPKWLRIDRLTPYFGDRTNWRANYVKYVNEATAAADKIWKGLRRRIFLVTEQFLGSAGSPAPMTTARFTSTMERRIFTTRHCRRSRAHSRHDSNEYTAQSSSTWSG